MRSNPNKSSGYAKFAGESAYPELWRDLLAAWVFGIQDRGNTVYDFSRNGFRGEIINDPTWAPGRFGNSLFFNPASNQYVDINTSINALGDDILEGPMSCISWCDPDDSANYILTKGTSGNTGWRFYIDNIERLVLYAEYSTTDMQAFSLNGSWVRGEIAQAAFTKPLGSTAADVKFYISGQEVGHQLDTNSSGTYQSDSGHNFRIARNHTGTYFDGRIEMLLLWRRVLSSSEIRFLWENPYALFVKRRRIYGVQAAAASLFPPNSLALTGVGR